MKAQRVCQLLLSVLAVSVVAVWAQGEYDYDYGYDSYYYDDEYDYLDDYGYYGDDDEAYYEYYGYYADDFDFYDDYDDYYYDAYDEYYDDDLQSCTIDSDGKVILANGTAPCNLKIEGVDKQADRLTGGMDGIYKLSACHNGRPLYKRENSPAGEDRVLWYSVGFGDWDVSKGVEPNEAEILMYGGEIEHASVPLFVRNWHLGADLMSSSEMEEDDYMPISVGVSCADGKVYKEPQTNFMLQKSGPVLTDDEIEAKYRYIYDKYGRRPEPSPTVNFAFVVMLVMVGLTVVLAIPYFLLRKKGPGGAKYSPIAGTSFSAMIQQSKKKQSGHLN